MGQLELIIVLSVVMTIAVMIFIKIKVVSILSKEEGGKNNSPEVKR